VRRFTAAALAGICVLAVACGGNSDKSNSGSGGPTSSTSSPPLAVGALDGLFLSPDQINAAMGTTGMAAALLGTKLADDTALISDKNCLAVQDSAEFPVYTGSGWTAMRGQVLQQPADKPTEFVDQALVLFPAATGAAAFFTASAKQWQSCSNRQYTFTPQGQSPATWTVGAVSNTNGMLSVRRTQEGGNGWNCQRALTVRNNVAVDVSACSHNQGDFGINIAHQIADKVPN